MQVCLCRGEESHSYVLCLYARLSICLFVCLFLGLSRSYLSIHAARMHRKIYTCVSMCAFHGYLYLYSDVFKCHAYIRRETGIQKPFTCMYACLPVCLLTSYKLLLARLPLPLLHYYHHYYYDHYHHHYYCCFYFYFYSFCYEAYSNS